VVQKLVRPIKNGVKVFEGGKWARSWNEAESYCNSFGGDLVDIQVWIEEPIFSPYYF